MYTIEQGDIIEVRVKYVQSAQQLLNVFHYRYDDAPTLPDGDAALSFLLAFFCTDATAWVDTWAAEATSDITIERVEAQVIFPIRRPFKAQPGTFPGTSIDTPLPQNVQLGITKVGSTTGRGKTGRVEVPGATAPMVANGETTPAGDGWLLQLADTLMVTLPLDGVPTALAVPVIWRRATPLGTEALTTTRVQRTVRVDHRRTVRVGK